jgi:tetratricopeptide (TPR) repeat protein
MKVTDNSVAPSTLSGADSLSEELHGALSSAAGMIKHNKIFAGAQDIVVDTKDYLSTHTWARETAEFGGAALLLGCALVGGSRLTRLPTGAKAVEELLNQDVFSIASKRSLKLLATLKPTAEAGKEYPMTSLEAMRDLWFFSRTARFEPQGMTRAATAVDNLGYPKIAAKLFDRALLQRPPIAQDFSPTSIHVANIDVERNISARQQSVLNLLMQRGATQLKAGLLPQANRSFDIAEAHAGETRAIIPPIAARTQASAAALMQLDGATWNGIVTARQAPAVDKVESLVREIAPNPVRFAKSFLGQLQAAPRVLEESPAQARRATFALHRLARNYETVEFYRQGPCIGQDYNPHWEANVGIALKDMGHPELALRYLNPYLEQRLPRAERLAALTLNSGWETAMRLKAADALIAQGQALVQLDLPRAGWAAFKKVQTVAPKGSPQFFQSELERQMAAQANRIRF